MQLASEADDWRQQGYGYGLLVVAGIGILVSIYNSMNDRKHEIAVMRALGAGRGTVMSVILFSFIGVVLGMYVEGFAFAYRATWESTFFDASQVRPLLAVVLGPASSLLRDPLPNLAG